jgi:hypothetical protein
VIEQKSFTAKDAKETKEQKSFTAKEMIIRTTANLKVAKEMRQGWQYMNASGCRTSAVNKLVLFYC